MTLVETLVAVSLGTILVGVITFIWVQSSRIYVETTERLDVYENMRTVLDVVERDLANTVPTSNMEFSNDEVKNGGNGNGRYDPGEEIKNPRAVRDPYRTGDPLVLTSTPSDPTQPPPSTGVALGPEFFWSGSGPDLNSTPYFFAPTIYSPDPYTWQPAGLQPDAHWRDEIYVRTFAEVNGFNQSAVVHYRLANKDLALKGATQTSGRVSLRRRVWWADGSGKPNQVAPAPGQPDTTTDQVSVLADDIVDFKVGFFFKQGAGLTANPGSWYHVRPLLSQSGLGSGSPAYNLVQQDEGMVDGTQPGRFMPALSNWQYTDPGNGQKVTTQVAPALMNQYQGARALSFYYEGWAKLELVDEGAVRLRPLKYKLTDTPQGYPWQPDEFDSGSMNNLFQGVRPGAKVFLFDAQDDDGSQIAPGLVGKNFFPDSVYTVAEVIPERQYVSVRLAEPIDFYRLERNWLATDEPSPQGPIAVNTSPGGGPNGTWGAPRVIHASFDVKYRVGFLPSAFLVRVSYDDRRHHRVVPIERVVRLLSQ